MEIVITDVQDVEIMQTKSRKTTKITLLHPLGNKTDIWLYDNNFDKICEAVEKNKKKLQKQLT